MEKIHTFIVGSLARRMKAERACASIINVPLSIAQLKRKVGNFVKLTNFNSNSFLKTVFVLDKPSVPAHKGIDIDCYGFHLACGESYLKAQMKGCQPTW